MIKRTIEISGPDTRLSIKNRQLVITRDGQCLGKVPCEDVGVLIVDNPSTVYTHASFLELAENGAVVVLCGKNHMPQALINPCEANTLMVQRLAAQVNCKQPVKKRLWQQIVKAKISNQAMSLEKFCPAKKRLDRLAKNVKSGDPENIEAQAARAYWKHWLGDTAFSRKREGLPPNNFLNYGYAVLRAAVARAIIGAGLYPALGIHHKNRSDAFCLASDLMEPLRPLVDRIVREIFKQGLEEINKETKTQILSMLVEPVKIKGNAGPLLVELEKMTASLVKCYNGKENKLVIPKLQ